MYCIHVRGESVAGTIAMQFLCLHKATIFVYAEGDGFDIEVDDDQQKNLEAIAHVNARP